jgi:hypothetical protein
VPRMNAALPAAITLAAIAAGANPEHREFSARLRSMSVQT